MSKHLFSCTGVSDTKETNIVYTGDIEENEEITDTYLAICNIDVKDIKVIGHIYACNFDYSFLSGATRLPIVRIITCRHETSARWNLAEISAWFYPDNPISINKNEKKITEKGTFKFRIVTWNELSKIKDMLWLEDIIDTFPESNTKLLELMCTNKVFLSYVKKENEEVLDTIKKTKEHIFTLSKKE